MDQAFVGRQSSNGNAFWSAGSMLRKRLKFRCITPTNRFEATNY
jgi:hypothetical protein